MPETLTLSFEEIFKLHYKGLCRIANKVLNDKAAAEDVVQDVFLKLWVKREDIPVIQSVKSYLYKSTINASLNYLSGRKRTTRLHDWELVRASEAQGIQSKELDSQVDQAINRLPPKCKTIFVLSRQEGMKYQQIADHLGISVKTVENQMGKALQILRERLKPFLSSEVMAIAGTMGPTILLGFLSSMLILLFFSWHGGGILL